MHTIEITAQITTKFGNVCVFKRSLMVKFLKFCSESFHRSTLLCSNVVKFVQQEIGEIVPYLPDQKIRLPFKLWLLLGSRPKSARATFQQCAHSAPDLIEIGLLSTEL